MGKHWVLCRELKRLLDIISVAIALPIVIPIMAVLALLIRRRSSGSILFRQQRIGFLERPFRVYKFRSMVQGAEELGSSVTARNDPRISGIGTILRKTKMDEIPQLMNVFVGDMSLVGPRPDVPEIVRNYSREMRRIFLIRPGITSVATVHLRDEEEILSAVDDPDRFYEEVLVPLKVRMALEHVDRNSIAFDLKILCQTVWMVTLGRWWPISEHPEVTALKRKLNKTSRNLEQVL